jgi:Ca2+-binding RTX toxin-like protein
LHIAVRDGTKSFAPGALKASAFKLGTFATAAGPQILYNKGSGELFLDVDGTGAQAAVKFAVVAAGTALTADHFLVICRTIAERPCTVCAV